MLSRCQKARGRGRRDRPFGSKARGFSGLRGGASRSDFDPLGKTTVSPHLTPSHFGGSGEAPGTAQPRRREARRGPPASEIARQDGRRRRGGPRRKGDKPSDQLSEACPLLRAQAASSCHKDFKVATLGRTRKWSALSGMTAQSPPAAVEHKSPTAQTPPLWQAESGKTRPSLATR